jgi:type II secretory pathway predicted ATPase ExeA
MHAQNLGISRPIIADTLPHDDAVFRGLHPEALQRDLAVALARKDAVAILSGASGTGKTTLALDACRQLSTRLAFCCISQPPLNPDEQLEHLLTEFGCETAGMSVVERRQQWRQYLAEMAATDTRVCLLLENAERFPVEVLAALHSLTAADAALSPGASIVLTTTLPAEALTNQPALGALGQRVRLRRRIEPLDQAQTRAYLEFKCRLASSPVAQIFADDAAGALFEFSGGVIRMIDAMLESALISAASRGDSRVTAALIGSLAESLFGHTGLSDNEVDVLLTTAAPEVPGPAFRLASLGPDAIPTLTELVVPGRNDAAPRLRRALAG